MIKRNYKRRLKPKYIILSIVIFTISLLGCEKIENRIIENQEEQIIKNIEEPADQEFKYETGNLYVNYISVGTGDCTVIRFPNNEILVIDTATYNQYNERLIKQKLNELGASCIDYLILTHPDIAHYGNTLALVNCFEIKNIYFPKVDCEIFTDFCSVIEKAEQKGSNKKHITMFENIAIDEVNIYFLYSKTSDLDITLDDINTEIVTSEEADSLSPIILLEYKGIKFIFEGDASALNERKVIENYKSNIYNFMYQKDIDLANIDFYMLSSHGSSFGNSNEFLKLLSPKNAIVSVGGEEYGIPNVSKIEQLTSQNCRVLRSDNEGNIVVCVNQNGGTTITTEYDLNNQ